MIPDKISYIHLRDKENIYPNFPSTPNGGATFAWLFDKVSQDIVVTEPAVCSKDEAFVKKTGRNGALKNLFESKILFRITRDEYLPIFIKPTEGFAIGGITPQANQQIAAFIAQLIEAHPEQVVVSTHFELLVRDRIELRPNNRVFYKPTPGSEFVKYSVPRPPVVAAE